MTRASDAHRLFPRSRACRYAAGQSCPSRSRRRTGAGRRRGTPHRSRTVSYRLCNRRGSCGPSGRADRRRFDLAARRIAREKSIALAFGFPERDGAHVYNTALVIGADGAVVASYRKSHLFGDVDRAQFSESGVEPGIFEIGGFLGRTADLLRCRVPGDRPGACAERRRTGDRADRAHAALRRGGAHCRAGPRL